MFNFLFKFFNISFSNYKDLAFSCPTISTHTNLANLCATNGIHIFGFLFNSWLLLHLIFKLFFFLSIIYFFLQFQSIFIISFVIFYNFYRMID